MGKSSQFTVSLVPGERLEIKHLERMERGIQSPSSRSASQSMVVALHSGVGGAHHGVVKSSAGNG